MAKQVIVIDDDPELTDGLVELLEIKGIPSLAAYDGKTAVEKIKKEPIDLAIVDLKLPDIDGLELVNKLKKIRPNAHFIILTGYGSIEASLEASHLNVYDYMVKPLVFDELLEKVKKCLGQD